MHGCKNLLLYALMLKMLKSRTFQRCIRFVSIEYGKYLMVMYKLHRDEILRISEITQIPLKYRVLCDKILLLLLLLTDPVQTKTNHKRILYSVIQTFYVNYSSYIGLCAKIKL